VDQLLGVLLLAVYIAGIVGLAAAITWAVIKIFPTERTPKKGETAEAPSNGASRPPQAGSLFRRSKRRQS
jgi:hypothetical protein